LISTISSRIENNPYGKNRREGEELVLKHSPKNLIIRLPVIHSSKSNRGIIFDILKSKKIFLNENSLVNPIIIDQFSKFFINNFEILSGVVEFGSKQDIEIGNLVKLLNSRSKCEGLKNKSNIK
jgi:dTDP-4-dehydrorhamnose reductase